MQGSPFRLTFSDDVFFVLDSGGATPEDYAKGAEQVLAYWSARKRPLAAVIVLPRGRQAPAPEIRAAIAGLYRALEPCVIAIAYVVEDTGFQGAVTRGILTGILLVQRHPFQTSVFADMPSGLRWLASQIQRVGGKIGTALPIISAA
jgi:hypothetical protein